MTSSSKTARRVKLASAQDVRSRLIRLAYTSDAKTRALLLPLLSQDPALPEGMKMANAGAYLLLQRLAKVFHNQQALQNYLKQHPKADPSKHKVKGKPQESKKTDKEDKSKPKLKDLSDKPGFEALKGLSPEKQREVVDKALELGKPEGERKPTPKDMSDKYDALKGLSPRDQQKVIERALKMASHSLKHKGV